MKTSTRPRAPLTTVGSTVLVAALAWTALGMTRTAHASDNVTFSVGIGVPGVVVGASNAYPVYTQPRPVYVQPRPVYVQPRPVYVQPAPVYYSPAPVYAVPQPVYYGRPHGWKHGHYKRGHEIYREPSGYYGGGYRPGYAPVYYQR